MDAACDSSDNDVHKFMFIVEWYDPVAQLIKKYLFTFYSNDQTVELYDLKNHRSFLRRCKQEGIHLENLYKTSIVSIMSRQMKIVEYANAKTKHKFEIELSQTFCMVKPDVAHRSGEIITFLLNHGFKITKLKMGTMTSKCATEFYKEHQGQPFFPGLIKFMQSGPSVAMSVIGENALRRWREMIGPTDSEIAKREAPHTLRAIYGVDITRNGVHGSKDDEHQVRETETWFPKNPEASKRSDLILPTCHLKNTTCCLIKPHSVLDGTVGAILNYIDENGFKITAMEMFNLDVPTAEEFLEVYKGVVPEYQAMVVQLTSGPLLAMEVTDINNPECSQENFRKLAGPTDPEIARKLRPNTIRAKFGKTKVMNAVHCTDLPDDAILEVEYFFKILQI